MSIWSIEPGERSPTEPARIENAGVALTWRETLRGWREDSALRSLLLDYLREVSLQAYCFETPGLTEARLDQPFEFILVDVPELDGLEPDPFAFAEHFERSNSPIVTFHNLGGDALLVAPAPPASGSGEECPEYHHLAAFLRNAPESQQHALLVATAEAVEESLGTRPLWLSTAGLGVAWLHMRIDDAPKYVRYNPYRSFEPE